MESIPYFISDNSKDIVVQTTFDPHMQSVAERAIDQKLTELAGRNVSEAAFVAMSLNGAVRALIGGENYRKSQFNRATQALRQSSSLFKMFVYLAAVEEGIDPAEMISDEPVTLGSWTPKNYGWTTQGEVPVSYGLIYSINTVTVRLAQMIGVKAIARVVQKMGVSRPIRNDLSVALGSAEMTLLELTSAYNVLSNQGYRTRPYGIIYIKTQDGNLLYQREADHHAVVRSDHLEKIKDMLEKVVDEGTGRRAKLSVPVWGKTGTSQSHRDAWFVGFTNQLTAGVWLGNDNDSPMKNVVGGRPCAEIWKAFMQHFG